MDSTQDDANISEQHVPWNSFIFAPMDLPYSEVNYKPHRQASNFLNMLYHYEFIFLDCSFINNLRNSLFTSIFLFRCKLSLEALIRYLSLYFKATLGMINSLWLAHFVSFLEQNQEVDYHAIIIFHAIIISSREISKICPIFSFFTNTASAIDCQTLSYPDGYQATIIELKFLGHITFFLGSYTLLYPSLAVIDLHNVSTIFLASLCSFRLYFQVFLSLWVPRYSNV